MLAPLTAVAQEYCPLEVRTATVTACFANTGAPVKPTCDVACPTPMAKPNGGGGPIQVFVQAPKCDSCGCDSCAHTNIYTTTYDAFCPTGVYKQEYVVTEVYAGMSAKPTMTEAPKVPFGFAVDVKTCNECGEKPVVATLTYPAEGCPYMKGMSEPKGAPAGSPAYAVCVDNPAGPGKPLLPGGGPPSGPPPPGPPSPPGAPGAAPMAPGGAPPAPGGGAAPMAPGGAPPAPGGGAAPMAPAGGAAPAAPGAPGAAPMAPMAPGGGAQPGAAPAAPGGAAAPAGAPAPPPNENNASPQAPPAKGKSLSVSYLRRRAKLTASFIRSRGRPSCSANRLVRYGAGCGCSPCLCRINHGRRLGILAFFPSGSVTSCQFIILLFLMSNVSW